MLIAILIPVALLLIVVIYYNALVGKKNQMKNAFSSIDVMLKKRFDLIPNLVEVVKQYGNYEQSTLSKIVELRASATNPNLTPLEKNALDQQLSQQVKGLMVNVEQYPDLKANTNYLNLQRTWTESEEQIAAARRSYNAAVTNYNDAVMMFPGNLFAGMFNFPTAEVLASTEEERQSINAKDLFKA